MLTPLELKLLLLAHGGQLAPPDTPAATEAIEHLVRDGLLNNRASIHTEYTVTPRGEAFIDMLCATPLPTQTWTDPRTGQKPNVTYPRATVPVGCPGCETAGIAPHREGCVYVR